MHRSAKQRLSTSTAIVGGIVLSIALPAVASAQDAVTGPPASQTREGSPEIDGADTGEIIVTARKRAEDIQTVPISITALTAKDLQERNIANLNDLANATPGVAITSIAGGNVQNIYLRGLAPANTANDLNVEANVGVFIDGIYQTSRNTLDIISVLDVGQIEIAKGPQSALFGRSTFAGALAISTKRPARDLEANVTGTVGINDDYRLRGTISGPIADGLLFRVGGGYLTYDGYGENAADPGDNLGGTEKYAVSTALEYSPHSDLTARLSGFFTHSKTEITPETLLPLTSFNCGNNGAAGVRLLFCGTLQAQEVSSITPDAPDTVAKTRQVSFDLNWRRQGVSVTSTTGYTEAENRAFNDYDGGSAGLLFGVCTVGNPTNAACGATNFGPAPYNRLVRANLLSSGVERVRTFSQEVRFQSDNDSPFSWLLGANYFDSQIPLTGGGIGTDASGLTAGERFVQVNQIAAPAATGIGVYDFTANLFTVANSLTNQVFANYAKASTKTFGIFGALGYRFGDLRVNAEGRFNTDRKRAQTFSAPANPASQPFVYQPIGGTSLPSAGAFPLAGPVFARSFESFTPRFTVDYQATTDIFFYASAAKGVRSGGFNTANAVSATGILQSEVAYDEESNWTYEGGVKSNLFDMLLLNASYFHTDWTNVQISAFTNNPTAINPVRIVQNAGNIKADGFELQADLNFSRIFSVGGSVVYSDAKFQKGAYEGSQIAQCRVGTTPATYSSAPGCPAIIAVATANGGTQYVPTLEGLRPPRSVKWQWNAHAAVNAPLSEGWRLSGRVDVTYTGPTFNNLLNTTAFGKRTLTNGRIGIEGDRFGISIWGNNIFDKTYVVNSINQPRAANPAGYSVPEIYLGEGRRYGVTASVRF